MKPFENSTQAALSCQRLTRRVTGLMEEVEAAHRQLLAAPRSALTEELIVSSRALDAAATALWLKIRKLRLYGLEDRALQGVLAQAARRSSPAPADLAAAQDTFAPPSGWRDLADSGDVHPILARVLEDIERDSRRSPRPLAVVSWQPQLTRFENPREALITLGQLPLRRRGAMVHLETGEIWVAKSRYQEICQILRAWGIRLRRGFRRVDDLGHPETRLMQLRESKTV